MDEVSGVKNVEKHTESEKLHFHIFLTIILLCKRAARRLMLDGMDRLEADECGAKSYTAS